MSEEVPPFDPADFDEGGPPLDHVAAAELLRRFGGRGDIFLEEMQKGARWVRGAVTEDLVAAHVRGERRIGFAPVADAPAAVALDFDGKHEGVGAAEALRRADAVADVLEGLGLPVLLERSRSGLGYHVWLLLDRSQPSTLDESRRLLRLVLRKAGLPFDADESKGNPGVFPHPPGRRGIGRAPFLPWAGLTNGRRAGLFVDRAGEVLQDQLATLEVARGVTRVELVQAAAQLEAALGVSGDEAQAARRRAPARPRPEASTRTGSRWAEAALEAEISRVAATPAGGRNDALNRAAFNLGQIVAGGGLAESEVRAALLGAAASCGLVADDGEARVVETLESGLAGGAQHPRSAPGPEPARRGLRAVPGAGPAPPGPDEDGRVKIIVRPELAGMTDEAVRALEGDEGLYRRGLILVRVVSSSGVAGAGVARAAGAPTIAVVDRAHLRERLDRQARWVEIQERRGKTREVPSLPPLSVTDSILARLEWPELRPLEAVVEQPVFLGDGRILARPGYDAASGIEYDPGGVVFPTVPDRPTRDQAIRAGLDLLDPLVDFPFASEADRFVALAAVLTLLGRSAIAGPCPLFAFRSPVPGSGKSLLADVVAIVGTGRPAARMSAPETDEEMRKRILSLGLDGSPAILVDNVDGLFGSSSIAASLTCDEFKDRQLGHNRTLTVPMRGIWLITGNNVAFKGDLGRRVVPADLAPKMEHPEDRVGFIHSPLLPYVHERRAVLVTAGLTILRAFHVAGRPGHGLPAKGSFENWDRLVRAAVLWVAGIDPLATCERIREQGDADLEVLRTAMGTWHEEVGPEARTAVQVCELARGKPELAAALAGLCGCDVVRLDARRLGYALRRVRGRVVGGRSFDRGGEDRTAGVRWGLASEEPCG